VKPDEDAEYQRVSGAITELLWKLHPVNLPGRLIRESVAFGVWNYIKNVRHCLFCGAPMRPGEEHAICRVPAPGKGGGNGRGNHVATKTGGKTYG